MQVKNKRTPRYNSMRELIEIALNNEQHPIGIFAPDEDVYPLFNALFDPILRDLNQQMRFKDYRYKEAVDIKAITEFIREANADF